MPAKRQHGGAGTIKQLREMRAALLSVVQDLNAEKAALEQLRAREAAILLSIGDGILTTDAHGAIIMMNVQAEHLLGLRLRDIVGKPLAEVVPIVDATGKPIPRRMLPLHRAWTSGTTTRSSAYEFKRQDGSTFPVAMMVAPVMFRGEIIGTVDVFRDISRRSRTLIA